MTRRAGVAFGLLGLLLAGPAGAAEEDDFEVRTTKQLLNLCTVPADHPRAQAAIHFCHGYLVGAYDYHVASNTGPGKSPFLCPPEPEPSPLTPGASSPCSRSPRDPPWSSSTPSIRRGGRWT